MELQEDCIEENEIEVEKPKKKKIRKKRISVDTVISQYTLEGKYVRTYNTIGRAAKLNGITVNRIKGCMSNKYKHAGGFLWGYDKDR